MNKDWVILPFAEAVEINPNVPLMRNKIYPFVEMQKIDPSSRIVTPSKLRAFNGGGSRFRNGDTLMARITPSLENGKIAKYKNTEDVPFGHGSTEFIVIRGKEGVTDNDFVYYLTRSDLVRNYAITQMTGTSGRQRVPVDSLYHLDVPIPPLPEQRAIAHILGTLDDKIELNRRMNETLEAMARALFKAWFVDFEPVRAKMDGRWKRGQSLPGMPAHLYDLFPDRLVDSELGEIPEGWKVGKLNDVLSELVSGARPKGGSVEKGIPSIGAENIKGLGKYDFSKEKYVPRYFFEKLKAKGADVRDRDVLLYKDGAQIGRKTYFEKSFPYEECAVNEHVFILRSKMPQMQRFIYFWLDQPWMTEEIISLNSNSAQPGINKMGIFSLPILIPQNAIVIIFDNIITPLISKLFTNCNHIRILSDLRDILLPKLINGEIRIKNAERFLKDHDL
ncbi:restriction endonuclease subunit S [Calditrichota bacterium GD2]